MYAHTALNWPRGRDRDMMNNISLQTLVIPKGRFMYDHIAQSPRQILCMATRQGNLDRERHGLEFIVKNPNIRIDQVRIWRG